jgi:PIN domain
VDDELLLHPGTSAKSALDTLSTLIREAQNIAQAGGGSFGQVWNGYLNWVEKAEFQLSSLFRSPMVWQEVHNDRYWHIRDLRTGAPTRPYPLIQNEATWQARRLQAIVDQLERVQRDFGNLPPDCLAVVPDTSVFMHYHRFFNDIDWPKEVHASSVRLMVPLLVVDELDDLSFRSKPTSERATKVLRALRKVRGDQPPEARVRVRAKVELQIVVDRPRHRRRSNNDDEILARAEWLAAFLGPESLRVAAIDYGMQLRAASRELHWIELSGTPEPSEGTV